MTNAPRIGKGFSLMAPQRVVPPTELPEAICAQLEETREVLRSAAAAAGIDHETVDAAVEAAVAGYAGARVHAFLGILVEREVRERLCLRRASYDGNVVRPSPSVRSVSTTVTATARTVAQQ